jgi:hypothetical protein
VRYGIGYIEVCEVEEQYAQAVPFTFLEHPAYALLAGDYL